MISYCVELLYHFSCGYCSKWFSIGDYQSDREPLTCPHCGHKSVPEKKDE